MPGSAEFVQSLVHTIETGGVARWLRRALLIIVIPTVALIYMYGFQGLATSQAIDQAQIGRSLATGRGWHTEFIRPRALGQLQAHGKSVGNVFQDTYNAPIPPLVDAVALFPVRAKIFHGTKDFMFIGDQAIAVLTFLIFIAALVAIFFTARRLFDQKLAFLVCGLVLVCQMFWDYTFSGLPQILLLFLFNATMYVLIRAVEAHYSGGRLGPWLFALGAGFGLLALTHALTIWIFLATFLFCAFFFRPRFWAATMILAAFLALYSPWLLRNFFLTGNPAGVAFYSILDGVGHSEAGWMRQIGFDSSGVSLASLRAKVVTNLGDQADHIFKYFGLSVVAVSFFFSFLHTFRHRETGIMRWFVLALWAGAVLGMAVYGIDEEQGVAANQLHLLFFPLMTGYGLAFLFVQWNRLGFVFPFARLVFTLGLFLICSLSMLSTLWNQLLGAGRPVSHFPPYFPPSISALSVVMKPDEVVASDMPWAVAWYANRRSLWAPDSIKVMADLSDYQTLGGPISGLFLTPISVSQNKLGDIQHGEWKDWAPVIQRTPGLANFPLRVVSFMGLEDYLLFSDRDRRPEKNE